MTRPPHPDLDGATNGGRTGRPGIPEPSDLSTPLRDRLDRIVAYVQGAAGPHYPERNITVGEIAREVVRLAEGGE